jgi:hypothetical protein
MKLNGYSAVAFSLLALSGCAALDQAVKDVKKTTAPVVITESLPQICQAAKDNPVRANAFYGNKSLTTSGKAGVISEGFQPRYRVLIINKGVAGRLDPDRIDVHAGTDNPLNIKHLSTGQTVRVSGVITDVSRDFNGCSITLKDATF